MGRGGVGRVKTLQWHLFYFTAGAQAIHSHSCLLPLFADRLSISALPALPIILIDSALSCLPTLLLLSCRLSPFK